MYERPKRITGETLSLDNYVEGYDVYNSLVIKRLTDPTTDKLRYIISKNGYRPDLIAEDIYGSTAYQGILMIQCGIRLKDYYIGKVIEVLPKSSVDSIINSL